MTSVFSNPELLFSILLTAKTCLAALLLFLAAGPALGWLLARRPTPLVRALGFAVTLPLVFPPVALGYILLTVLGRTGFIGETLSSLGMSLIFNQTAVIVAGFVAGLPLVVKPLQTAFASERLQRLEEAAQVLGASPRRLFFRVTLPLVRPSLAAGLLMGCARVSGEVGITMMLGGNISGRTNTLSLEIFNAVSRADFDEANGLCLLLCAFAAAIFLTMEAVQKRSVKF